MKQFFLTGVILISLSSNLIAQSKFAVASQTLNIHLGDVIEIRFVSSQQSTGPNLQMVFSSADDYYNGIETEKQMLKVRSNSNFTVSVRTANVSGINNNMLPSFIYLRMPDNNTSGNVGQAFSNSTYQKLTGTDMLLLADAKNGENQTFSVQYKAKPGTMVAPGVYTIDVIFTASRY